MGDLISVSTDVGLVHNGQSLLNNSIIDMNVVGDGLSALLCLTNELECCESSDDGGWVFPNGTAVSSVFETRGPSIIGLNRADGVDLVNGLFRCEIPNAGNTETLYVGVYSMPSDNPGKYAIRVYIRVKFDLKLIGRCGL